jgi:hypothetical protein
MRAVTTVAHLLVRLAGLTQIILGGVFWTRSALSPIARHMLVGLVLVLLPWLLAGLAALAGV